MVVFVVIGNGQVGSGNVMIVGLNVNVDDVILVVKNQVNIVNMMDIDLMCSMNELKSVSVGVLFGIGGFGVFVVMFKVNGDGNSDLVVQNNSYVNVVNGVMIILGGDMNIIGLNVNGKQVNVDVGGNLNIVSVQDMLLSVVYQLSLGGGFSISQGGVSVSFSQSNGNVIGSYVGVNE